MGRHSTGAWNTDKCKRIEMSFLKKHGYLEHNSLKIGSLSWNTNGRPTGKINFIISTKEPESYLRLIYIDIDRNTGKETNIDYTIRLVKVNSNLGKSYRYYFLCPFTDKTCSILYKTNGYYWKHREAFKNLFYDSQLTSKSMKPYKVVVYDRKIRELRESRTKNGKRINSHYRSQPTKFLKRLYSLEYKGYKSALAYNNYYIRVHVCLFGIFSA